jgi:hypothetical protein
MPMKTANQKSLHVNRIRGAGLKDLNVPRPKTVGLLRVDADRLDDPRGVA